MNQYKTKPQINIFDGLSTSRTMGSRGVPNFSLPNKNDTSILAKDLLPLHNKRDDRFKTDIQLNGRTRFEEKNTIIQSLEEEIVTMKHKLSFVYEKDKEIGKLKETINQLKKENKDLLNASNECIKLRLENKQLKDKLDLELLKTNNIDKLKTENKQLQNKLKELINSKNSSMTDINDMTEMIEMNDITEISDITEDLDNDYDELMDIDVKHLRVVLFNRLRDKQTEHIENLINEYNLKNKNKIKKSVLETMLEKAIHL